MAVQYSITKIVSIVPTPVLSIPAPEGSPVLGPSPETPESAAILPTDIPPSSGELFTDDGVYDEVKEAHRRHFFCVDFQYADFGRTFDPTGNYLCGGKTGLGPEGCNKFRPGISVTGACTMVEGAISGDTGSCRYWENVFKGDPELKMIHPVSKEEAAYTERPKERGFGCQRCEYSMTAKQADSQNRPLFCQRGAFRVYPISCCALNEGPDDVEFEEEDEKPNE